MSELGASPTVARRLPPTEWIIMLVDRLTVTFWRRLDVVLAVAVMVGLATPVLFDTQGDSPVAVAALAAGAALPLAVRRRWPVAALAVIVGSVVAAALLGISFTPFASNASPSLGLAMYTVATRFDRRFSLQSLALVVILTSVALLVAAAWYPDAQNAVQPVAALVGWLLGDAVRARRTYRADRADWQRREDEERTRRVIAEERLQLSRDLHDVISHNLTVIAVQSGVGRMVFDSRPDEARNALIEIANLSRSALAELRRLLNTVRDRASPAPSPGLDGLSHLIEQIGASGVDVTLERRDTALALPPTVGRSAYRIVQEALTNVVKHAGPTRAQVVVEQHDVELLLEVTDEGPAAPPDPGQASSASATGGWGLAGMEERAELCGGTMEAGPRPEGGFRVAVRLPISQGEATGGDQ